MNIPYNKTNLLDLRQFCSGLLIPRDKHDTHIKGLNATLAPARLFIGCL